MLHSTVELEQAILKALVYISPNSTRDEWVKVGMALKAALGDSGFQAFDGWSQNGETYNAKATKDTWRSISSSGGVGAGTLFFIAKDHGFRFESLPSNDRQKIENQLCRLKKESLKRKSQEDKERAQKHKEVAGSCESRWEHAEQAQAEHSYLIRKQVKPFNLKQQGGTLWVPLVDVDNRLWNIQRITPEGKKLFEKGGRITGLFSPIGTLSDVVYICEGYATGATIHQLKGYFVACAMTAGNLTAVARAFRDKYPKKRFIIVADNDRFTPGNPGLQKAKEAAKAVRGSYVCPSFNDEQQGTDFNDLAIAEGAL